MGSDTRSSEGGVESARWDVVLPSVDYVSSAPRPGGDRDGHWLDDRSGCKDESRRRMHPVARLSPTAALSGRNIAK